MGYYIHDKRLKSYNFHEEVPVSSNKQTKQKKLDHRPHPLLKKTMPSNKQD